MAEAILAHTTLGEPEIKTIEALAVSGAALSVQDVSHITKRNSEDVVRAIDSLADHNLVEPVGAAVKLHPLIADFYWKQVRSGPNFKTIAQQIGDHAKRAVASSKVGTRAYVDWLSTACRMLYLCGDFEGAQNLRRDLSGELKVACIDLYQREEYELSLRYCEEYLRSDPQDFEVKFHKARCLSRLEKPTEALEIIDELLKTSAATARRKARLHFAKGRTYLEKRELEKAKSSFMESIRFSPDYVAALQAMAEVLLRLDAVDDAAGFLDRALRVSPMDSFVLSLQAEVLWRRGDHQSAIKAMELVIKSQPQNATFLFRLGRFLQQTGKLERAYSLFDQAKASDLYYWDARLSLASVAIDLGRLDAAQREIDSLRSKVPGEKRRVLDNIEAMYELASGNIARARELAGRRLEHHRDVASLGLMAKIEIAFCKKALADGMKVLADSHRTQALKLIDEGLKIEPSNPALLAQSEAIGNLNY